MSRLPATLLAVVLVIGSTAGCSDAVDDPEPDGTLNLGEDGAAAVIGVPDRLDFGRVQPGDTAEATLEVTNNGDAPLEITGVTTDEAVEIVDPAPSSDEPVEIEPEEHIEWTVLFDAEGREGAVDGEIAIESNDRFEPVVEIPYSAEALVACAEIEPADRLDFGEVLLRGTSTQTVEVTNCEFRARLTVRVDGVVGDEAFGVVPGDETEDPVELEPGESLEVPVVFDPTDESTYEANLEMTTDDPDRTEQTIELVGSGVADDCVRPVITAGDGEAAVVSNQESTLNAEPLDTISLDATGSLDPQGGSIEEVAWSIVDRPEDSGAILEEDADALHNELYLDLAGTYVVELDAKNDDGDWACYPAHLTIEALIGSEIHVQLVWDTPGDPYRHNDEGTDLDLHFLHPDGVWNEAPWDCHWQNPEPVWNSDDDVDGNPTLDIDETQGWGPENVNLDEPDPTTDYSVGVHYFTDRGFGVSYATVRVFLEGQLVEEIDSPALQSGQFWNSVEVDGGLGGVEVVDEVYEGFPE